MHDVWWIQVWKSLFLRWWQNKEKEPPSSEHLILPLGHDTWRDAFISKYSSGVGDCLYLFILLSSSVESSNKTFVLCVLQVQIKLSLPSKYSNTDDGILFIYLFICSVDISCKLVFIPV